MEWINVNDKLPKESGEYLVSDGEVVFSATILAKDYFLCHDENASIFCYHVDDELYEQYNKDDIQYWAYMPSPPESEFR